MDKAKIRDGVFGIISGAVITLGIYAVFTNLELLLSLVPIGWHALIASLLVYALVPSGIFFGLFVFLYGLHMLIKGVLSKKRAIDHY